MQFFSKHSCNLCKLSSSMTNEWPDNGWFENNWMKKKVWKSSRTSQLACFLKPNLFKTVVTRKCKVMKPPKNDESSHNAKGWSCVPLSYRISFEMLTFVQWRTSLQCMRSIPELSSRRFTKTLWKRPKSTTFAKKVLSYTILDRWTYGIILINIIDKASAKRFGSVHSCWKCMPLCPRPYECIVFILTIKWMSHSQDGTFIWLLRQKQYKQQNALAVERSRGITNNQMMPDTFPFVMYILDCNEQKECLTLIQQQKLINYLSEWTALQYLIISK